MRLEGEALRVDGRRFRPGPGGRIFVVGAGKAVGAMARRVEGALGGRIAGGVVSLPEPCDPPLERIQVVVGGHPLPDEGSLEAGRRIAALLEKCGRGDLVLALISGGGSALLELPVEGVGLEDLRKLNDLLVRSGLPVWAMNAVRRRVSRIKGGGLLRMAAPAMVISLILSDVVGDPLPEIASGPTIPSHDPPDRARRLLQQAGLLERVPQAVRRALEGDPLSADAGELPEACAFLIGGNRQAAMAACGAAGELGFTARLLTSELEGEAREVGRVIASLLKEARRVAKERGKAQCLVMGGETTVTVSGDGVGGRNLELALGAALGLQGKDNVALLAFATDGLDGNSPAAGAFADGETIERARRLGLDPMEALAKNDTYSFFHVIGDALHLGRTGTNVNDLIIGLAYPSPEGREEEP